MMMMVVVTLDMRFCFHAVNYSPSWSHCQGFSNTYLRRLTEWRSTDTLVIVFGQSRK